MLADEQDHFLTRVLTTPVEEHRAPRVGVPEKLLSGTPTVLYHETMTLGKVRRLAQVASLLGDVFLPR